MTWVQGAAADDDVLFPSLRVLRSHWLLLLSGVSNPLQIFSVLDTDLRAPSHRRLASYLGLLSGSPLNPG